MESIQQLPKVRFCHLNQYQSERGKTRRVSPGPISRIQVVRIFPNFLLVEYKAIIKTAYMVLDYDCNEHQF